MPKSDELCPLGFMPHSIRPTRCKRCFRGYEEHKKKISKVTDTSEHDKSTSETVDAKQTTSVPQIVTSNYEQSTTSTSNDVTSVQLRRRRQLTDTASDDHDTSSAEGQPPSIVGHTSTAKPRTRTRPSSWGGTSDNRKVRLDVSGQTDVSDKNEDDEDLSPSGSPRPTSGGNGSGGGRSRRVQILSTRELRPSVVDDDAEIPETASADVAFILRVKTSTPSKDGGSSGDQDDSASVAASTTTETTLSYHDSVEDMQATVQTLRRQVDDLQRDCRRLEAERDRARLASSDKEGDMLDKTATELLRLKAQVHELKTANEDLSDDNRVLRLQTNELRAEVDELQSRARSVQSKCLELETENTELKREMQDMEEEIDEMQDNFQEDQAGQFHDMRKNMEQLERNCRILQFKLRKAERRCEQLETDKAIIDGNRVARTVADGLDAIGISGDGIKDDETSAVAGEKMLRLEAELRASRQVAAELHAEAEILRTRLGRTTTTTAAVNDLKTTTTTATMPHFTSPARSEGDDSGQLIRELYDTVEREKDLKEQLKFSEEEATSLRKKMASLEEENDSLVMQIKKMVGNRDRGTAKTRRSGSSADSPKEGDHGDDARSAAEGNESVAEVRVQLELVERESKVLRTKMADTEAENERLTQLVRELEQKQKDAAAIAARPSLPETTHSSTASSDVVHYQQTIRILETEAKELRRKLIDKQRENEQIQAEIDGYKSSVALRRGSRALPPNPSLKSMRRSASLDSDDPTTTFDLRRQLQLLEQEAVILRQRTLDLENENERIGDENKRLTMMSAAAAASSGKTSVKAAAASSSSAKVREQEQEIARLQEKIKELTEAEKRRRPSSSSSVVLDLNGAFRQRTPKKVTENCTRPELRKYVGDLEEEIAELGRALQTQHAGQVTATTTTMTKAVAAVTATSQQTVVSVHSQTDDDPVVEANKELQAKLSQKDSELNKAKTKTVGPGPKMKALREELDAVKKKLEKVDSDLASKTKRCADLSEELERVSNQVTEQEKMMTEAEATARKKLEIALQELEIERTARKKEDTLAVAVSIGGGESATTSEAQLLTELQRKHEDFRRKKETEKIGFEKRVKELEGDLTVAKEDAAKRERELCDAISQAKSDAKRRERIERDYEAELRERDDDLNRLRDKVRKSEVEIERLSTTANDGQVELQNRIKGLERSLAAEKSERAELTTRHEALEEDYVIVKAQLVETEAQYGDEGQLMKNLRDTFNQRQDSWIREKLDMQEKIKELLCKLSRANTAAWDLERDLKDALDERRALNDQVVRLQCKVDETKKTLESYEKIRGTVPVANGGGNELVTAKEMQDFRNKMQQEEKLHRSELAAIKFRYDQQLVAYQSEIQSLHLQNAKYRRQRDAYGLMTKKDGADGSPSKPHHEQMEELRARVDRLKQEKDMAVDRLDSAERSGIRAAAEFAIEKSSWEIRMAEMQTKINEMEEANVLLGSGKSRIVGVKSRLELAWQKERDEQRRLLADAKRQLDELRKNMGNDQDHTQAKIQELQEDLLQLRDAHSKMRSFNDRVRRDKDRIERERDELRLFVGRRQQLTVNERRSVADLVDEMHKIQQMVPSVLGETSSKTSTVQLENDIRQKFKSSLKRITNATEELQRVHGAKEENRIRKNLSYRRAMSEDEDQGSSSRTTTASGSLARDDPLSRWQNPRRLTNYPASPPSMYISPQPHLFRKSLSFDQSFGDQATSPWRSSEGGDTSGGSSTSLMAPTPSPRLKKHLRRARQLASADGSLDYGSDMSAATSLSSSRETSAEPTSVSSSTQTASKSGIKRNLLKRFTKSKSVEGTPTANHIKQAGMQVLCSPALGGGSSSSVSEAAATSAPVPSTVRDAKMSKALKSRIANLFKKSSSRSNSVDEGIHPSTGAAGSNTLSSRSKSTAATNPALHKRYGSTSAL